MIIDFHTHLGKGEPDAGPLQRDLFPEDLIKVMDEAGVDKAVVFPVTYKNYWQAMDEIKSYVDKFPDRLIGFGRVGDTEDAPEIVDYAIKTLGFKGLKIHHGCDNIPEDSSNLKKVLRKAEELQIPIIFDAFGPNTPKVCAIAENYKFPAILGHMGGLWNVEAIDLAIKCAQENENACLETSSVLLYRKIEEAVQKIGANRILFGTDGPGIHPKPEIEKIKILHISEEEKEKILGLNAARLLGL